MDKFDTKFTNEIVCPYCGFEFMDSYEFDEGDNPIHCEECKKDFVFTQNIEVTYNTYKLLI